MPTAHETVRRAPDADIRDAYAALAKFAAGIIPHTVQGRAFIPDMEDAAEFQNDLRLLAERVDRVILAYGEYLEHFGVLSERDVKNCFTDILLGAIDGNATYVIERGVEETLEEVAEGYRR
jgi:hypothetical protein